MMKEYLSQTKTIALNQKGRQKQEKSILPMRIVSKIELPPMIRLSRSEQISVSFWIFIIAGALIGFLSGLLGIGGGFITLPFLIYVIGAPARKAVGTSLISVFFTSSYGAFAYAISGHVNWMMGIVIFAGSILGIQLGVAAVKTTAEMRIKILFAILLFCVAASVFLKQIELKVAGSYLVLSGATFLGVVILFPLVRNSVVRFLHR